MCTLGAVTLGLTAASSLIGGYAQYQQSQAQTRAAQQSAAYNSQLAANEYETNMQLAQRENQQGASDREQFLRSALQEQGQATSMLAASGFDVGSGSALNVLAGNAQNIQHDVNRLRSNSDLSVWQYQSAANNALNQKAIYDAQYQSAKNSSPWASILGQSVLGGLASGLNQFSSLGRTTGAVNTASKIKWGR